MNIVMLLQKNDLQIVSFFVPYTYTISFIVNEERRELRVKETFCYALNERLTTY